MGVGGGGWGWRRRDAWRCRKRDGVWEEECRHVWAGWETEAAINLCYSHNRKTFSMPHCTSAAIISIDHIQSKYDWNETSSPSVVNISLVPTSSF